MHNTNQRQDINDCNMSLGEHLDELRKRLIYGLVGLLICTVLSFMFCPHIIRIIERPYTNIMGTEARLQSLAPSDG